MAFIKSRTDVEKAVNSMSKDDVVCNLSLEKLFNLSRTLVFQIKKFSSAFSPWTRRKSMSVYSEPLLFAAAFFCVCKNLPLPFSFWVVFVCLGRFVTSSSSSSSPVISFPFGAYIGYTGFALYLVVFSL